jgi:3-hydroxyacyl-[acyl-carrier-protein] dehydratase
MRFLLVDRIVELEPGVRIVAERHVPPDEDYFQDHFPGFPVVPGVLLTEMQGQAAAQCLEAESRRLAASGTLRGKPMLARILGASFRQWVRPDQTVTLQAIIASSEDRFAQADCEARVGGKLAAQAKLFFAFAPREQFSTSLRDEVLERYLAEHPL